MLDIVFCNVPYIHLDYVYSAPAILRGVVQQHGFSARTVDFGIELFKLCNRDLKKFYETQSWFIGQTDPTAIPSVIEHWLDQCVTYLQNNPSRYIGISVLTNQSQVACFLLIDRIRKANISSKIVIGGRGIEVQSRLHKFIPGTAMDHFNDMAMVMTRSQLVDHAIRGDGEDQILQVLDADRFSSQQQLSEVIEYPIPDYSDYEFDCYHFEHNAILWPISGSKGCVRACDFCDVETLFGRYRYRSGRDIAKEMIYLNEKVGARSFGFTDSLVNGGLKPFREFLEIMAEHNQKHPDREITWGGAYICRPPEQIFDGYYELLAQAGGRHFTIGAESGSDHVLSAMNKRTDVASLFAELEQFRRHGITSLLLLTIGHWSETHDDFLEHLDMLIKLTPYVRSGTVKSLRIGVPMMILTDTPSDRNAASHNIVKMNQQVYFCGNNVNNTISEKIYRQLIVLKLAQSLQLIDGSYVINDLTNSLGVLAESDAINEFYDQQFAKLSSSISV